MTPMHIFETAKAPASEPKDENLIARALRLADELDKLGDYMLNRTPDDARGKLQKDAADTMRQLADQIALIGDA